MRKSLAVVNMLVILALAAGCGGKKDTGTQVGNEYKFELGTCPVASIKIEPSRFEDADLIINSGYELKLEATAYNQRGNPVNADLTWSLRYPSMDSGQLSGNGHSLEVADDNHAIFKAGGYAPGLFTVLAQDRTCNLGTSEEPQYVEGETWIKVNNDPAALAACGRMRVTDGGRTDRMGDIVIAASKVLLIAEVSGHEKLGRNYQVKFYIDDKAYPSTRPLYRDNESVPLPGMEVAHISILPLYTVPGDHAVRYELLDHGEMLCGSRTERFSAK